MVHVSLQAFIYWLFVDINYLPTEGKATILIFNFPAGNCWSGLACFHYAEFFLVISSIFSLKIFSQSSPWFIAPHLSFQRLINISCKGEPTVPCFHREQFFYVRVFLWRNSSLFNSFGKLIRSCSGKNYLNIFFFRFLTIFFAINLWVFLFVLCIVVGHAHSSVRTEDILIFFVAP